MINAGDARDITRDVLEDKYGVFLSNKIKDTALLGFGCVSICKSELKGYRDLLNLKHFVEEFTDFRTTPVYNSEDDEEIPGDKHITISW